MILHPSADRLLRPLRLAPSVRPAREADVGALAELVAPHVASGTLLPRALDPEAFLVVEQEGALVGCVALSPWTSEVVELGTLVSNRPGLGRLLVEAACAAAQAGGFRTIVALTGVEDFFSRCGFAAEGDVPWARARGLATRPSDRAELGPAVAWKAEKCSRCARLGGCRQVLLSRRLAPSPVVVLWPGRPAHAAPAATEYIVAGTPSA